MPTELEMKLRIPSVTVADRILSDKMVTDHLASESKPHPWSQGTTTLKQVPSDLVGLYAYAKRERKATLLKHHPQMSR